MGAVSLDGTNGTTVSAKDRRCRKNQLNPRPGLALSKILNPYLAKRFRQQ